MKIYFKKDGKTFDHYELTKDEVDSLRTAREIVVQLCNKAKLATTYETAVALTDVIQKDGYPF